MQVKTATCGRLCFPMFWRREGGSYLRFCKLTLQGVVHSTKLFIVPHINWQTLSAYSLIALQYQDSHLPLWLQRRFISDKFLNNSLAEPVFVKYCHDRGKAVNVVFACKIPDCYQLLSQDVALVENRWRKKQIIPQEVLKQPWKRRRRKNKNQN